MKIKTSITISDTLLKKIDIILNHSGNRSSFIETAIQFYIDKKNKDKRDQNDLEIINSKSEKLNNEAEDVLSYQDVF
jgi:metal-responsive CopG/Arc/MetJ family transcriptional regulator